MQDFLVKDDYFQETEKKYHTMKKIFWIAPLLVSALFIGCKEDEKSDEIVAPSGYKLVWNDEFDYTGLPDSDKWGYDVGNHGWGNQELQNYLADTKETANVEGGNLTITAFILERDNRKEYMSSRMVTREKGDWLYGRIDVRAKMPRGVGTWPAIWMLPTDWEYGGWPRSGEIDIMEHVGYDHGNVHATVHTEAFNHSIGTQRGGSVELPKVSDEFHVYSIVWDADKIGFMVDENLYFTFLNSGRGSAEWPFDKRFHLILNIAIGGTWGGRDGVDDSIFPTSMVVDYVRVFQREEE